MHIQARAARDFVKALHAHKRGDISTAEKNRIGERLNAAIAKHGKPGATRCSEKA